MLYGRFASTSLYDVESSTGAKAKAKDPYGATRNHAYGNSVYGLGATRRELESLQVGLLDANSDKRCIHPFLLFEMMLSPTLSPKARYKCIS